jgi:flagellar motor protein MotB
MLSRFRKESEPMVESDRFFRVVRILAAAALPSGCAFVPKERLDDCHKQCQNFQLEASQLKDDVLKLRATHQDLAHRSIEDAKRLKALDEENRQLERSVIAYQEDRDRLAAAFEQFKRQLAATSDHLPAAMLDRFEDFSRTHPSFTFDAESAVATFPTEALFQPGSADLTAEAETLLSSFAAILGPADAQEIKVRVVVSTTDPEVRLTSLTAADSATEAIGLARAQRVREVLVEQALLDPSHVEVEGEGGVVGSEPPPKPSPGPVQVIEIRLRPALSSASSEGGNVPQMISGEQTSPEVGASESDPPLRPESPG